MRVVMIARTTLFTVRGGDTIQVIQTATNLARYNIIVDIKLTNEKIKYEQYDLIHFFNISRPADILFHIRKSGKPFVISPIFIDYSEYDQFYRKGIAGIIFRFLSADGIEYLKTMARWISGKDKLMSLEYAWKGQRNSVIEILKKAKLLLPNSHSEYKRLVQRYDCNQEYVVIPNGIDEGLFEYKPAVVKDPLLVICVARIEGIKNQFNLIRALNNSKFNLVIIGAAAPNQMGYYRSCRELAADNIRFIDHLPQEELVDYYQKATVQVLPSWFETTGLSSLEAAAMGCNIVITDKGDTKEYFGTDATYCDPISPENIYIAVEKAAELSFNDSMQKKILTHYTWDQATIRTIEAYKRINNIWV